METKPIRIDCNLIDECNLIKPSYMSSNGFINHVINEGLIALDTRANLGKATQTKEGQKEGEPLPINNKTIINNKKVKNKISKFRFKQELIPFILTKHAERIAFFWSVKSGAKSEASWKQLHRGLIDIQKKYGDAVVSAQIELAIVGGPRGPWSSITLANYEKINGGGQALKEPAPSALQSRVFTAKGGFES